jgi:hypothetical protein
MSSARLVSRAVHSEASGWERLARPGFTVTLEYPAVTPRGHAVKREEGRVEGHPIAGDFERVHLSSPESGELYVELARFANRTPADEYREHRPYLAQRFGDDAVSALAETTLGDRPAWVYDFRWDEGERSVLLLAVGGDTYRVIHDPRSELNARVLATLTVAD